MNKLDKEDGAHFTSNFCCKKVKEARKGRPDDGLGERVGVTREVRVILALLLSVLSLWCLATLQAVGS